ncbi:hypothetical protein U1Q18_039350, partial [Sarracenia purpurea var. burkii]
RSPKPDGEEDGQINRRRKANQPRGANQSVMQEVKPLREETTLNIIAKSVEKTTGHDRSRRRRITPPISLDLLRSISTPPINFDLLQSPSICARAMNDGAISLRVSPLIAQESSLIIVPSSINT